MLSLVLDDTLSFLLKLAGLRSKLKNASFRLYFYGKGDLVIMLDGFDEIFFDYQLKVIKFMNILKRKFVNVGCLGICTYLSKIIHFALTRTLH